MRNHRHPDYIRQLEADLTQAEADLDSLLHRAKNALPTLFYIIEESKDWRRDVRIELHKNLLQAVDRAEKNQTKRRHHVQESPPSQKQPGSNPVSY